MSIFKSILLWISLLTFGLDGFSQEVDKPQLQYGVELGSGLSYTGFNANLGFLLRYTDHEWFIGPKWVYSDNYLIGDGTFGIHTGYRYRLASRSRINTFVSISYQNVYADPPGDKAKKKNITNEFHFSYGLTYQLSSKIRLGNTLGLGGYIERLIDPITSEARKYNGYSTQFRIFISYDIK